MIGMASMLKKVSLVAIDLDDTLLDEKQILTRRTIDAIRRAVDAGVAVTIATGRMYCSTVPFARELGLKIPLITYNGALIKDHLSGEVLLHQPVPIDLAREVGQLFRERGWYLQKYVDDELIVEKMDENALYYSNYARVEAKAAGDDFFRMDKPSTKMLAMATPDTLELMQEALRERFGTQLYVARSKKTFLEIINPIANKGTALEFLANRLGIAHDEVMAIGDSMNDIDMISYAGCGIAMGNAHAAVKQAADAVTLSNADDGVATAIEKYVLT